MRRLLGDGQWGRSTRAEAGKVRECRLVWSSCVDRVAHEQVRNCES
jgi:hypothetical protein